MSENTTTALSDAALSGLPPAVTVPHYPRSDLRQAIVHIGVGGFHRAHLATYVHELAERGHRDWGIVGVGTLESDIRMAEVMSAQNGLYCLVQRSAAQTTTEVIGSIVDYVHAHADPDALTSSIASPDTQIVSLTITEGGYPVDDTTGAYIPEATTSHDAFSRLVAGLDARRRAGTGPVTVLSCDNILGNGQVTRTATLGTATHHDPELAAWIAAHVSFPNSMVDRITPATKPADIRWLHDEHGIDDGWPVVTEPFRQWVVEDDFAGDRLPLEELDVIITDDIEPYELMKLRLLNAGHSCLAYLSSLRGHVLVDEAMADDRIRTFVSELLHDEALPTITEAPGIELPTYIASLIERFSNPGVGDQIDRLCLDGTSKFPKFLLPTLRTQLERGGPIERMTLALAGWCEYLATNEAPSADPLLAPATELARVSLTEPTAFLRLDSVFDADLAADERFRTAFTAALHSLRTVGVDDALAAIA